MKYLIIVCLSLLCVLSIGGVGYYYVTQQEDERITSPMQPTPISTVVTISTLQADTQAVTTLVNAFYETYALCLASPTHSVKAQGRIATFCQENSNNTTPNFVANVTAGGIAKSGADPITCSQNPPRTVTAGEVDFEDPTRAIVVATAEYGGFAQKNTVVVSKEEDTWKVDNVICQKP